MADWGDYDGDGDYDVIVAGNIREADNTFKTVLRTYTNDSGTLVPADLLQAPSNDWLDLTAATWADYDSDGDTDLLVTGSSIGDSKIIGKSDIYANDAGTFTPVGISLDAPDVSFRGGTFTWFDIDGDGDLDYLMAGAFYRENGNGLLEARMHLHRNVTDATNAAPSAPTGLSATPTEDGAVLSWQPPVDDHTPSTQLTYDLEIVALDAPADTASRLPEPGNISNATSWTLSGLTEGQYRWRVRAVDSSYTGSELTGGTFTVGDDRIFGSGFEVL
jgi:hypothetical protein